MGKLVLFVCCVMIMCTTALCKCFTDDSYHFSPVVSSVRRGTLTLNSFEKGGDGGGPSACDGCFHPNTHHWVALPSHFFNHNSNCFRKLQINGRRKSAVATVIDECGNHCHGDIVDVSESVWEALGVHKGDKEYGYMPITWNFIS